MNQSTFHPIREHVSFGDIVEMSRNANYEYQASDHACLARDQMSPYQYAREFQTVRVDIGRSTGKTNYVCRHATLDDIVVTHNWQMVQWFSDNSKATAWSAQHVTTRMYSGRRCVDVVFIDEASRLHPSVMAEIYERFSHMNVQQFVLLG